MASPHWWLVLVDAGSLDMASERCPSAVSSAILFRLHPGFSRGGVRSDPIGSGNQIFTSIIEINQVAS
jgi:hypothetical protein